MSTIRQFTNVGEPPDEVKIPPDELFFIMQLAIVGEELLVTIPALHSLMVNPENFVYFRTSLKIAGPDICVVVGTVFNVAITGGDRTEWTSHS